MTRKVGPLMTYEQAKVISLCSLLFFFFLPYFHL